MAMRLVKFQKKLYGKIAVYIFERLQEISQRFNNLSQDRIPIYTMYKHSVMIW